MAEPDLDPNEMVLTPAQADALRPDSDLAARLDAVGGGLPLHEYVRRRHEEVTHLSSRDAWALRGMFVACLLVTVLAAVNLAVTAAATVSALAERSRLQSELALVRQRVAALEAQQHPVQEVRDAAR